MTLLADIEPTRTKQQEMDATETVKRSGPLDGRNVDRLASIGEMVTTVAHESRNFLQRIVAATDMLQLQLEGDNEALKDVARIRDAGTGLHHLLESLREFAGPMRLDRHPCDMAAIWRAAWSRAHPAESSAVLSEQTEPLAFSVQVDEFRLGQVFRNLFENSRAACSEQLHVNISCRSHVEAGKPMIQIVVQDNGPGLTQEQQQHLFDPFYTTKSNGTGLGMTISQRIIEQHGGRISLRNTSGPGTSFCISLPGDREMTETLRIAIADDEPAILEDLRETLEELGHDVVAASGTGAELVAACRESAPQLVITDIRMPDMDGLTAASQLYEHKPLPIIIASAHSDAEYIERALDTHVLAYLVKPVTNESLSTAVTLAMRRFREFQGLLSQSHTLRQALDDRKLIARAKGVLMQRGCLTEEQAFDRLEELSNERSEKLTDIARAILTAEEALTPGRR